MSARSIAGAEIGPGTGVFDVVVIGGGVVGCAVARLLSLHDLDVALIEAGADVGAGTSKANTAILHTGFDATPGSIESRLVARGYALLRDYAPTVGVSVEATGALLVAWDDEQADRLPALAEKAAANGYERTELVDVAEVYEREPHLGPGATAGMVVPDEHLIDPWSTPIAFALQAVANGCQIMLNRRVTACNVGRETTELTTTTPAGTDVIVATRYVVNAAGLHGDTVHRLFGLDGFTIRPRRGELIVFDKLARPLLHGTVLPVPTAHTKGVLVAPTVFGNIVLGPTADDIDDRNATGSTGAGISTLLDKGRRIVPSLIDEEVTAVYAGLRAATEHSDYQISTEAGARYVGLGGIRSTGLTASMALAEEALSRLRSIGLSASAHEAVAVRLTPLGEAGDRPYQHGGRIVCHCERVTESEIMVACSGPLPATDVDGLRRRTRTLAGRCQGFYCLAEVTQLAGWNPAS
jgi:glycerol-3-phosphate dehydrogenase